MLNRINDWLSIGNYRVTAGIATLYLHVNDGEYLHHDLIAQGAAFIKAQHREGKHILVACGAGRSRSVTFGMAALKGISGFTLLRALCDYYHEESEYETLWRDVHFNKE